MFKRKNSSELQGKIPCYRVDGKYLLKRSEFDKFIEQYRVENNSEGVVNEIMDDIIDRIFELSQERLIEDKKIENGTLMKTDNVNRRFLEKEIVYKNLYDEFVELGRNKGKMKK